MMQAYEQEFSRNTTAQAINSIYQSLNKRLAIYNNNFSSEEKDKLINNLLSIHGIAKHNFNVINTVERLIQNKLNHESIDENSNKNDKTTKGILKESEAPFDKIVGYRYLYRKLKELYGKQEATRLTGLMYDYSIAISDSTNILLPYCWAFDASVLVTDGKPFKPLKSKPAKRVDSYISILNEVIHQMSNHLAGAIAIGTFFIDIARLMIINEKIPLEDLKNNQATRKYVENQFQRFVHGVNSLSRSGGQESPFTNVSIFDKVKLYEILNQYAWYFNIDLENNSNNEVDLNYVIDYVTELQFIYIDFFSQGDPCLDRMPYRFPVSTINLAKTKQEDKWIISDKEFVKEVCKKDIYRYNIFASEGSKIASCCRLVNDAELFELGAQANSFGAGGSISLGSHRVAVINFVRLALMAKTQEEFDELLYNTIQDAKKILYAHKKMMYDFASINVFIRHSWIRLDRMFSTIGIIGMAETDAILKEKFGDDKDYVYEILTLLNKESDPNAETNKEYAGTCVFNIEQIPGESMSHRLPKADNLIFGTNFKIYSNQTVPLWDKEASIWDRIMLDGKYNALFSGGGIVHINTGEMITPSQAEELIDFAVECECEHFAITGTFCVCSNGHTTIGNREICPICEAKIESKIARVVGMFTPVEDWSFEKFEFDFKERKEYKNGDFNKQQNLSNEYFYTSKENCVNNISINS